MNKRLEKRHARQVARAKMHAKVSEPDVRSPEEIAAARERSHAIRSHNPVPEAPYAHEGVHGEEAAPPEATATPEAQN